MLKKTQTSRNPFSLAALVVAALMFAGGQATAADESSGLPVAELDRTTPVDFEKEILPILKRSCIACHNRSEAESDVMLESPREMLEAETDPPPLLAGDAAGSQLFLVASHRGEPVMPPKDNDVGAKPLSPDELALLRLWIDQGARGEVRGGGETVDWRRVPQRLTPIYAVAVAPEGDFVAAGRGQRIQVIHAPSKRSLATLVDPALGSYATEASPGVAHLDFVQSLAFSPDGRRIVSGGYRLAKVWRRGPAGPTALMGRVDHPSGAVAAGGGRMAVGDTSGKIHLFDIKQRKLVRTLDGHGAAVSSLALTADGSRLASSGADRRCGVWDSASGRRLAEWEAPSPVRSLAWVAGQTQIAGGGDDALIRLWPSPIGGEGEDRDEKPVAPLAEWKGHTGPVTRLVTVDSAGKQVVSAGQDSSLRLWDVAAGSQLRQFDHGGPVADVAVSGQRIVSVGANKIGRAFQIDSGQQIAEFRAGHVERQRAAAGRLELEIAGRYVSAAKAEVAAAEKRRTTADGEAKKAAEEVKQVEADLAKKVETENAAKENEKEKAAAEKKIAERTLQASNDRLARMQVAVEEAVQSIADAQAAVTQAEADEAQIRESLAALEAKVAAAERPLTAVAVSADASTFVAAGDDGRLHTFDLGTGAAIDTLDQPGAPRVALVATADGHVAALAGDGTVALWSAAPRWELERTLGADPATSSPADRVTAVAVSPNGKLVATGGGEPSRGGEILIWDIESGSLVRSLEDPHSDTVLGLAFSPRGRYLASCGADRQMKVFQVSNGELACVCEGHTHHVLSVAWRADGRLLATGGADKVVKVWAFPSGEQQKTIEGFGKEVTSLVFLGLSDNFVTGSGSGAVTTKTSSGGGGTTYTGTSGFVYSADSSADGKTIAAGDERGVLWVWPGGTTPVAFAPEPGR